MNKHVSNPVPAQMYSERWEIDHLCNRFGLSRYTAKNLVESYSGDRAKMEEQAERLAAYENIERWGSKDERRQVR